MNINYYLKEHLRFNFIAIALLICTINASAQQTDNDNAAPISFSKETNYLSSIGFARWKYFQEFKQWPPSVIEKQIGWSPVDGGFDWFSFLVAVQDQSKKYPYARTFVNSWHIDTIGPDWIDDYYIIMEYRRSAGVVCDPHAYKRTWNKSLLPLNDAILSNLLKEHKNVYAKTKNGNLADDKMLELWRSYKTSAK